MTSLKKHLLGVAKAFPSKAHDSAAIKKNTGRFDLVRIMISYKTSDATNKVKGKRQTEIYRGKKKVGSTSPHGLSIRRESRRNASEGGSRCWGPPTGPTLN